MRVSGQYLKARMTSVGTAKTVMPTNTRPVVGPVVGPSQKATMIDVMKATPERMLIMPPDGMKTSSTTSAQPTSSSRIAQAMSGITIQLVGKALAGQSKSSDRL